MRKSEIDDLLGVMLESYDNVSDLNITCERPLQVEAAGELVPVPVEPAIENLTPFQTEIFALNLINNDRRLTEHLLRQGSCDSSYFLPGKARFRVNIFSQRGSFSVVLRKLETKIPTVEELKLPEAFKRMPGEKNGLILVTGATGCSPRCTPSTPARPSPASSACSTRRRRSRSASASRRRFAGSSASGWCRRSAADAGPCTTSWPTPSAPTS